MKKYTLLLVTFLILGCVNQADQVKNFEEEVIAIHDEVMPKTIDINRVQRTLKKIGQDSTLDESTVLMIRTQVGKLNAADEAMTKWMAEYKPPSKEASFEANMEHLKKEETKITEVKNLINSSLKEGQDLLKKLEEQKK